MICYFAVEAGYLIELFSSNTWYPVKMRYFTQIVPINYGVIRLICLSNITFIVRMGIQLNHSIYL
jgi:hypothetical protein